MKLLASAAVVMLLLSGCRTAVTPSGGERVEVAQRSRVLLVSFDGIGADPFESHLRSGTFGAEGFARAVAEGTRVHRVVPVTPTLTSVAHVSIATGAGPEKTGIVANTFHRRGEPLEARASGFIEEIDVETIWEAAKASGRKVGTITFPGLDGNGPRRTADWGLIYSEPLTPTRVLELNRSDFDVSATELPAGLPPSHSPAVGRRLAWTASADGESIELQATLVAIDTTNDSRVNYDRFVVAQERSTIVDLNESWFPVWKDAAVEDEIYRFGAWSRLISASPSLSSVRIYLGAVCRTLGYPTAYRRMIDERIGFWPGPPDDSVAKKWIRDQPEGLPPGIYREQLARFSRFFTDATLLSMKEMEWDLILGYQPIIDEAEHQFRIVNDRQLVSDPEKQREGAATREEAYRLADVAMTRMMNALPDDAAIVITGDHGLAELEDSIKLNRQLIEWGYAQAEEDRLSPKSRWAAFTSGSFAQLYFFAQPPQLGPLDAAQIRERDADRIDLIAKLRTMTDDDGKPVFELVRARTANDHPNHGDILAFAYPRFSYSSSLRAGDIIAKTDSFGQHGGLSHHPDYHTILLAFGKGVPKRSIERMHQTGIARFVAGLAGIRAPSSAAQ
jgi:predicted AlkP superfamily pyrophosphatase or phosphodiesterase